MIYTSVTDELVDSEPSTVSRPPFVLLTRIGQSATLGLPLERCKDGVIGYF